MQATITVQKEVTIKTLLISAQFSHVGDGEDDSVPTDFPLLNGSMWNAHIDVDTGVIADWPQGDERELYVKVCDQGNYSLLDENGETLLERFDNYVPNNLVPGEYGDYIDLKIDGTGKITNWPASPSIDDFLESED